MTANGEDANLMQMDYEDGAVNWILGLNRGSTSNHLLHVFGIFESVNSASSILVVYSSHYNGVDSIAFLEIDITNFYVS